MQRFLSTVCFLALSAGFSGRCQGEVSTMDSSPGLSELVRGNNEFALALYGRLASGAGNRFISPFSVSCALAMTYSGARGQTAAADRQCAAFQFARGRAPSRFPSPYHRSAPSKRIRNRSQRRRAVELSTANALWTQSGEPILPEFQKLIESNYEGGLIPVDFRKSPAAATSTSTTGSWNTPGGKSTT